jgi:hypothetical protein
MRTREAGEEEHVLAAHEAICFDASVLHGYRRIGHPGCSGFFVTQG